MIYDLADTGQKLAFDTEQARQSLIYGNTFVMALGRNRVLLIEPWDSRAAAR